LGSDFDDSPEVPESSWLEVGEFFAIERKQDMKHSRIAILGLVASMVAASSFSSTVRADAAPAPTHVAVINLQKVYQTMQETADWQKRLSGLQGQLKTMQDSHQLDLKVASDKITNMLKDGTDAKQKAMDDLDAKSLQFQLDEQTMKVKMAREANRTLKAEFDEIQAAVADMSKKQGLDLVLVANNPEIPPNYAESVDFEHLAQALFSRNLMYVSDKTDITSQVLADLDAAYKTRK
jgi:Skp family chaperone for outer membrane proteins